MNDVETKYFKKYGEIVGWDAVSHLIEVYKSGDIIFESARDAFDSLTEAQHEDVYASIDKSDLLSDQEKIEAIVGLMMIIDGSCPESRVFSNLIKVLGKEVAETFEKKYKVYLEQKAAEKVEKRKEAVEELANLIKLNYHQRNKHVK